MNGGGLAPGQREGVGDEYALRRGAVGVLDMVVTLFW